METVNRPWKTTQGVAPPLSPGQDPRPFPGPDGAGFSAPPRRLSCLPRPPLPLHFLSPARPHRLPVFLVMKDSSQGRETVHEAFSLSSPANSESQGKELLQVFQQ